MNNKKREEEVTVGDVWKKLKDTFSTYKKVSKKKFSLEEYLEELSPYVDRLVEDLETEDLRFEKGYCELSKEEDKIMMKIVLFYREIWSNLMEKKEMLRELDTKGFQIEEVKKLGENNKIFEIRKGQ